MPNGRKCPYTADIALSLAMPYSNEMKKKYSTKVKYENSNSYNEKLK
jgi:hypothetical protein